MEQFIYLPDDIFHVIIKLCECIKGLMFVSHRISLLTRNMIQHVMKPDIERPSQLKYFTSLTQLDLSHNDKIDNGTLALLTSIKSLDLSNNNVIHDVTALTNLQKLEIQGYSAVKLFPQQLCSLRLVGNTTVFDSHISHLSLISLTVDGYTKINGSCVENMTRLKSLTVTKNMQVGYLTGLTQLSSIRIKCDLRDNDVSMFTNLVKLQMCGTTIKGKFLPRMTNLRVLSLVGHHNIKDKYLIQCMNLLHLSFRDTGRRQMITADIFVLTNLRSLDLYRCDVSSRVLSNLSNLVNLKKLEIRHTAITTQHISMLTALSFLDISHPVRQDYCDISHMTALTYIDIYNNNIPIECIRGLPLGKIVVNNERRKELGAHFPEANICGWS